MLATYTLTDLDAYATQLRALANEYRTTGDDDAAIRLQSRIDAVRDEIQTRLNNLVRSTS